jgi:hypothetical protein
VFGSLRATIAPSDWPQLLEDPNGGAALIDRLTRTSLRQWFERDGGAELELLLQHLMLREYFVDDYYDGTYRNLFERAEDRFLISPGKRHVQWNGAGIEALLFVVGAIRQRLIWKQFRRSERKAPAAAYFCELCDELTQRMSNERAASMAGTGSARYCVRHASGDRSLYERDVQNKQEFELLLSSVLGEARRDPDFRRRLIDVSYANWLEITEHTKTCSFCGGHPLASACFDPEKKFFSRLITFHANARKVAYRLAGSHNSDGRAYLIDEAVQRGKRAKDAAQSWRLSTDKAIGQHCGLALARLIHQRVQGAEIARRLGISPSAVSQRKKNGLNGSFDFTPTREMDLVWWPFDDIAGPHIARFPTCSLGTNWRHSEGEYHHLACSSSKPRKTHRRKANSSSLPTKSSARR